MFMNRVFGKPYSVDELEELDEELYRNLFRLKETENVESWRLTFVASGPDGSEIPLIKNGGMIPVTDVNKLQYIHLLARHKLVTEISRAAAAFAEGLNSIVPLEFMSFFSSGELELLISGEAREGFDVDDLRQNCHVTGYTAESKTIEMFWRFAESDMTASDRVALLNFVTSSPRAPLMGFRALKPQFGIQRVPDPNRLPTASTCVNLLKLPDYQDYNTLKEKLLLAIRAKSGFDFS
jgi:ubiquitin-protein ligase E3 C